MKENMENVEKEGWMLVLNLFLWFAFVFAGSYAIILISNVLGKEFLLLIIPMMFLLISYLLYLVDKYSKW